MQSSKETMYGISDSIIVRDIDGITYLLGNNGESIFSLNEAGSFIIEILMDINKATLSQIHELFEEEFEVDKLKLEKDLKFFIDELYSHNILMII